MSSRVWIGLLTLAGILTLAGAAFAADGAKAPNGQAPDAQGQAAKDPTEGTAESDEAPGPIAPNWMLPDLGGNQVSLYQEAAQGRTTVMVFWATWCRNCKVLLTKLNELKARSEKQAVAFYLLNIWEDSDPLEYVEQQGLDMQVILRADHVAKRFNVGVTPGVVVVNAERRIIYQRPNGISMDQIVSDLEDILDIKAAVASQ